MSQTIAAKLLPIRDQKNAPTCLAFAASAAHEYLMGASEHLSTAYLYGLSWPTDPALDGNKGLTTYSIKNCLSKDGQINEVHKPYDPWLISVEYPGIQGKSKERHFLTKVNHIKNEYDEVRNYILKHVPVVLILSISNTFFLPDKNGYISDQDTSHAGRHAVLAISSFENNGQAHVGIRNSWGHKWGDNGYAYITKKYMLERLKEAVTLEASP